MNFAITGVQAVDPLALAPAIATLVTIVVLVLVDAVAPATARLRRVHDVVALAGLGVSGAFVAVLGVAATGRDLGPVAGAAVRSTVCVAGQGKLVLPSCSFVVSPLTLTLQAVVVVGAVVCLLLAVDGPGARDRSVHHLLLLATVTGALVLAGSRDLATLVVAFETASLPVIGLVALRRDAQGAQGAVTLLLTAVASLGLLLVGVAMLLLATGSLHLDRIAAAVGDPTLPDSVRVVAVAGTLLAVAGIAFKLSVVPFHLWTPDTYAGAPLPVAAFLSVVSKAAGLAAVVVLLGVGLPALGDAWSPAVAVLAALTLTVGNLVALRQTVAVRLLAWSTVAQAGWVVLPLGAVASGAPGDARQAVAAAVGYLVAYGVASLLAFSVVVLLARHHPAGEDHTLEAYRGLARREPVAAGALGFALLCLAGLPPGLVGLVAKVVAVRPLVDAGVWWLAVVAAANVALGVAYYLRWTALLVVRPTATPPTWRVRPAEGIALGMSLALCVAFSVLPQVVAGLIPTALR
ncbi:NADH-quinone oxidoreductase subunit N [Kineosporia sp. A_224]|uniref:NADH-quinone oxidoreductase subunit N n=1 Tax=Kineosporia sp. A_224 TaxID=1962180 RepID=UPI00117BCABF|nr:NADH-quinone oxidoreductase subunit N [Kineosporia sp. A_224]